MNVDIYIETNVKSPKRQRGTYGYILVYRPPGKEEDATVSDFVTVDDVTPQEIELKALVKALGRLRKQCDVSIIQSNQYIKNMSNNLDTWKKSGYKTAKGEDVKYKDLWQQLAEYMEKQHITWGEDKGYQNWLKSEVTKKKEDKQDV